MFQYSFGKFRHLLWFTVTFVDFFNINTDLNKYSQRTIITGHPEFYKNFVPGLDKFDFIVPDWARKTTPFEKHIQTRRFVGVIHLNFPKNWHFLPPDMHKYVCVQFSENFAYALNEWSRTLLVAYDLQLSFLMYFHRIFLQWGFAKPRKTNHSWLK